MDPEFTALLREARNGDREASQRLLEENRGLLWSVARRFFGRGVEPDDLFQLAGIGFLKAVQGFDPDYGTMFSTYAVPKIAGEILRFLRDDGAVKLSRGMKERIALVGRARSGLEQRLGREPTVGELSAETGLSKEELALTEAAGTPACSLQAEQGEEGFSLEMALGDAGLEERMIERVALDQAIASLEERQRMVIALRFFHGLTQDRTARVLGISQVQVSRTERKALTCLREALREP